MNKFIITALSATDSPTRLPPAMNVGIHLDAALFDALLERTAIKPDFFVRDMLTWEHLSVGLIHDPDDDVARVAW